MYEIHITIEPVFGKMLSLVKQIAESRGFKIAELMMAKRPEDTPERSKFDSFMTGHAHEMELAEVMTMNCLRDLRKHGVKVWRYKIEQILVDSKYQDDPWRML